MDLVIRDEDCKTEAHLEKIQKGSRIWTPVRIHKDARISDGVTICERVTIGQYSSVMKGAWLSQGCTIMPGVRVACGSVISQSETIREDTIAVCGGVFVATLTEYGIRIGCHYKTPGEWSVARLNELTSDGVSYVPQLQAVINLWYASFEWIE